jgi:hypothetical protein
MIRCSRLHWPFVLIMVGMIAGSRVVTLFGDLIKDVVWGILFGRVVRHRVGGAGSS